MSCKATSNFNIPGITPNLDCLYLVIQGRSTGMNNVFGLPPTLVTWDKKVTSTQRPFWEHQSAENFKISPILSDLCHMYFFLLRNVANFPGGPSSPCQLAAQQQATDRDTCLLDRSGLADTQYCQERDLGILVQTLARNIENYTFLLNTILFDLIKFEFSINEGNPNHETYYCVITV